MPTMEIAPPITRPSHSAPVVGSSWAICESAKTGSRKFWITLSTPGIAT